MKNGLCLYCLNQLNPLAKVSVTGHNINIVTIRHQYTSRTIIISARENDRLLRCQDGRCRDNNSFTAHDA